MFNLVSRVITLSLLVIPLVGGCATVPKKMEPAQTLPKGQAIVFGKIDVFVDGEHVKMSASGLSSRLTIEFRQKGSSEILEYKIGVTGHFYWALAPGKYEVLGTHGYGGSGGFGLMLPLAQRVWLPFTVEPGKSTYIGDLTLELGKETRPRQRLDNNHSEAMKEH